MTSQDELKVIVVEDEKNTCIAINYILSHRGYRCVIASNGSEALEKIFAAHFSPEPFDLIICDLAMPLMTGEELIIALNKRKIDIPILVITGIADKEAVVRLLRLGVGDFMDKPFERRELEERIDNVLKRYNRDRNAKTQLERLAKMGEVAMASIHDIGNMIGASLGFMELIVQDISSDDPLYSKITKAFSATKRSSSICRDFMDLRGKPVSDLKAIVDMNILVERVIDILSDVVPETIQIKSNLAPQPLLYNVDTWRFQHALVNLGINAVDAMPNGGVLEFSSGKTSGTESGQGECFFIAVKDTGAGMTEKVASRVFENGFTTRESGHGFGLSSIQRIVKNHQGYLEMDTAPGCGTTFRLLFPVSVG